MHELDTSEGDGELHRVAPGVELLAEPMSGTAKHRPTPLPRLLASFTAYIMCFTRTMQTLSGHSKRPKGLPEALKLAARRILRCPDGDFVPSPPPGLLDVITDEILVIALDAVQSAAHEAHPVPSGLAQMRMLAWVLADARGAGKLLDKASVPPCHIHVLSY